MHGYSNFLVCETCKQYYWLNANRKHTCPPKMQFKYEYWGDEWQDVYAHSMDDAAREIGRRYNDNGDYSLMDEEIEVIVKHEGVEKTFIVSAEMNIEYYANEKEETEDE